MISKPKKSVLASINFENKVLSVALEFQNNNQMRVTIKEKAPKASKYFGAPCSAPCSIKSKSSTKFSAAMATQPS